MSRHDGTPFDPSAHELEMDRAIGRAPGTARAMSCADMADVLQIDDEPTVTDSEDDLAARMREALGSEDDADTNPPWSDSELDVLPPDRRREAASALAYIREGRPDRAIEKTERFMREWEADHDCMAVAVCLNAMARSSQILAGLEQWAESKGRVLVPFDPRTQTLGPDGAPRPRAAPAPAIAAEKTPRSAEDAPFYVGDVSAVARVEVLPDGTIVASGSSLENFGVVVEAGDGLAPSPSERALIPLFRKLVSKLGPGHVLALLGQADRLNESASGEKAAPVRAAMPFESESPFPTLAERVTGGRG